MSDLSNLRANLRVIFSAAEMALRSNLTDGFVFFGIVIQPTIIALLAFWMLRDQGNDAIIYVVIGSGMTGLWTMALFISGQAISGERWTGTLEMLVATPTPLYIVVIGKTLANVLQSLVAMVATYALAGLVFGVLPRILRPGMFTLSLFFAVISYISFGLIISPLFVLNPQVRRLQNGLEFPVYILGGFFFPIALLPGWTTPLSYILPPYWAARALHGASSGGAVSDILFAIGMMILFILIYGMITARLFQRILYKARVEATLVRQ
ncbi:MAG: ABC transporter permease [Chloroflexi bacterium]|nr:ABC transporter permease [Chloroflexota bacterium]